MISKQLPDLQKRLFVSSIVIGTLLLLLIFSDRMLAKTILVLMVGLLAGVGVWEYGQFARAKELRPAVKTMVVVAVCEVFACFSAHKLMVFSQLPAIVLALGAVAFFLLHFRDTKDALVHVAVEFFSVCYVAVPLSFMLAILYPISHTGVSWDGRWWLLYLIVVTKITDVGAYFVGRLFGKRPLAPSLSPKKTIEGAVAGFGSAVLFSLLFSGVSAIFSSDLFILPSQASLVLGACMGIAGQMGDLAESLLKRDAVMKDSNSLPGLGGVLDMVDSLLWTAPILYFYLKLQW